MEKQKAGATPIRRHFAAGDFITRSPAGSPQEILIDSPLEKPAWKARVPGGVTDAEFPGTAILFEGAYYEIIRIERKPGEKPRYLYSLAPWDTHSPLRASLPYTAEECERAAAAVKREKQDSVSRTLLTVFSPITGLLPAADQRELESTYGIDALRCTTISAVAELMVGAFLMFLTLLAMFSPESLAAMPVIKYLSPLVIAVGGLMLSGESVLRLINIRHDEPMGSLFVSIPLDIFRDIRRRFDPALRQKRFEKMEAGAHSVYRNARDEVREIDETDLEIISILPKPEWSQITGISYNGIWYGCLESGTLRRNGRLHHRFVLRKAPVGSVFRTTYAYTPEDVRNRYREKRKQDLITWVETFAPFWGLLSGPDQKKLAELYEFKPLKYTAWTILILGTVGGINVVVSFLNITAHTGGPGEAVWLLGGGYFLLESIIRTQQWLKNEPSGSILGALLQPFAAKLLSL